jgi:hypothetical protein
MLPYTSGEPKSGAVILAKVEVSHPLDEQAFDIGAEYYTVFRKLCGRG